MFVDRKSIVTLTATLFALILPACHRSTSKQPRIIARAQKAYSSAQFEYEQELQLLDKNNVVDAKVKKELNDIVLVKNEEYNTDQSGWFYSADYYNYPYMQYKYRLDKALSDLERSARRLPWTEDNLTERIYQLVKKLGLIKKIIITSEQYGVERTRKAKIDAQEEIARANWASATANMRTAHATEKLANDKRHK